MMKNKLQLVNVIKEGKLLGCYALADNNPVDIQEHENGFTVNGDEYDSESYICTIDSMGSGHPTFTEIYNGNLIPFIIFVEQIKAQIPDQFK